MWWKTERKMWGYLIECGRFKANKIKGSDGKCCFKIEAKSALDNVRYKEEKKKEIGWNWFNKLC